MPDEPQRSAFAQPLETLAAVIGTLFGTDSPPLLLSADTSDHTIALPEGWPTRALADCDTLRVEGPLGPIVVLPRWERRPLNSPSSPLVDDVRAAFGLGGPAVVLLPAGELESARSDELRRILMDNGLSAVCLIQVPGVHTSFVGAAIVLKADGQELVRYFDAHSAARSNSVKGVAAELGRLLRMRGGATEHGYVLRDRPDPHNLGMRRNDPRLAASRAALAEYGNAVRIDEIFDLVPFVHPLEARRRPATRDMEDARLLSGRDLQFGRIVEPDQDTPRVPVSLGVLLRVGDLVLRSIVSRRSERGLNCTVVTAEDLPAAASNSVLALRPKPTTPDPVVAFVAAYLASPAAVELADAGQLGGDVRVARSHLAEMTVPTPDQPMQIAVAALAQARDVAGEWQGQASRELASLFADSSPAANRARVLASSRTLRQKIAAAQLTDDFATRVRSRYPLPVAARWRAAQAEASAELGVAAYTAILEASEVLLSYLGCTALALSRHAGLDLSSRTAIRDKLGRGQGPTLGDWVAVLKEVTGKKSSPISELIGHQQLNQFASDADIDAAVRRLGERRNSSAHLRKIDSTELPQACRDALKDLELMLGAASFLEDLPLLLVDELNWDSLATSGSLGVRSLVGDHPVVSRTHMIVTESQFERGSLYTPDATGTLLLLRPFVVASTCATCRTLSTFHIDAPEADKVRYKSFEHGHPEDGEQQRSALAAVGMLPSTP